MLFTPEHDLFRTTVREFLAHEISPRCEEWEHAEGFPAHDVFPKLAQLGLIGLEYAPADGGQGADHWYTVVLCEELGRLDCNAVPMGFNVQAYYATASLAEHGSAELKARWLAPSLRGELVAAIAVTETSWPDPAS